ncbi:MAG: hypothetical protein A2792_03995 [Sphingomonadales bacterium RIFCSPHIGHO2_01_FULL_65_20]|jgi:hypothetical protein|uniref:hypothetical protein n=1 Tax=unclassified Blastomonas TaxID=2626550 RepID=UPI00082FAB67|nr:hypothetical protein [Blastomonas sp.]OHC91753.1 MAG: hypothetical protein A2792_03995 [Sphingomonadales bacterium RIFCSPHIGHO2_01_FULL_65_20]
METGALLRLAYLANILILVPVCWAMFFGNAMASVFQGTVTDSLGLRLLVGSLWAAILSASVFGLFMPVLFAPLLLVQIIYKALWLTLFVLPLMLAGKPAPWGIASIFAAIVLTYPFVLWRAWSS